MTEQALRVLLVAEESAGVSTLHQLAETETAIVAVMAAGDGAVAPQAERMGLEVWPAELVKDSSLASRVRELEVDVLLNVHSLHIIDQEVLRAPRIGCFNLHPGPLPQYAGLDVVSWALYRGEKSHGITLHWMEAGVDTGAIAYSTTFEVSDEDTALTVYEKCLDHGMDLISRLIEVAAREPEEIPREAQDLAARRYFRRRAPQNGRLDWSKSAQEIVNFVRACDYYPFPSPWGMPATYLNGRELRVAKAERTLAPTDEPAGTVGVHDGYLEVAAADEWVWIESLSVDGELVDPAELLAAGQRLASSPG